MFFKNYFYYALKGFATKFPRQIIKGTTCSADKIECNALTSVLYYRLQ